MEIYIPDWIVVAVPFVTVLYFVWLYEGSYLEKRGVASLPTYFPLVGPMAAVIVRLRHFKDPIDKLYSFFPDHKYVGYMMFMKPVIYLRDLELIKQVAIKDFDSFQDHSAASEEDIDPLFGKNLFALKGQKWRDMRSTLSPAFTSSKMRNMFQFVSECGEQMANFFMEEMKKPTNRDRGFLSLELKDAFTRYSNDVIASTVFGIKVNSLTERENEFYTMGKSASNFNGARSLKFIGYSVFPKLMTFFKIRMFDESTSDYFRHLVMSTMRSREEQNIHRPDMVQLLMNAKKGTLKHEGQVSEDTGFATVQESVVGRQTHKREWSDDDLTAQAVIFFLAGFDTSAVLLCFMAHELTVNGRIQKKLQTEVDQLFEKCQGKITYGDINSMKYMDMVVSETLRMWPPGIAIERKCTKDYELPPGTNDGGKPYPLKKGEVVWIPIYSIHHDPQYYENPYVFDPERFSDENKGSINPAAFIPFGVGPRNCIGSRFALMQAKGVIFHLMTKFEFVITEKTQIPLCMSKSTVNAQAQKGFWIGLKPRRDKQ